MRYFDFVRCDSIIFTDWNIVHQSKEHEQRGENLQQSTGRARNSKKLTTNLAYILPF